MGSTASRCKIENYSPMRICITLLKSRLFVKSDCSLKVSFEFTEEPSFSCNLTIFLCV